MSVSLSFSNHTYQPIPDSDSTSTASPNKQVDFPDTVCSGKNKSFLSSCSALKFCIFITGVLSLAVLFLFVSGVMYVNFKDRVIGITNKHSKFPSSSLQSKFNMKSYIHTSTMLSANADTDCDTDYAWGDELSIEYDPDEWENKDTSVLRKYDRGYLCYRWRSDCEYCYNITKSNDDCPYDSRTEEDPTYEVGCYDDCSTSSDVAEDIYGETLYCYYEQELTITEDEDPCYAWDSIITKVIKDDGNNGFVTQDVMINDIKLGDYVITGINGQYSKVIDRSHFSIYDRSTETTQLIELCFDQTKLSQEDSDGLLYDCIKLTGKHLIYVNGNDLDSLDRVDNVNIGDYLYHTGLKQFVEISEINTGIKDYYRNVITENGNLVINNGFLTSTIPEGHESLNGNFKDFHLNMVMLYNGFYKVFTLNGIYEQLWESEWFDHILRLPTKNALGHWVGYGGQFSDKYPYPMTSMIIAQSIGCLLLYIFTKGMISLFELKSIKSVSY